MPLTDKIRYHIDQAAELIQDERDKEDTLYEAMDYLEDAVYPPDPQATTMTKPTTKRVVRVWMFAAKDNKPDKVEGNVWAKKAPGAKKLPGSTWDPNEVPFPKLPNGNPDPQYMLLQISEGSTTWCYYLSDGTKVCYTI